MRRAYYLLTPFFLLAVSCSDGLDQGSGDQAKKTDDADQGAPLSYPQLDDQLHHDTLLIQTTFDLRDGTYMMVASNVSETFEGLRLYRYRFKEDSVPEMLAISAPAYDSWTMLPTFFSDGNPTSKSHWVLANFGERESWGQKVLRMEDGFVDHGFMDVALPERVMEDDTLRLKRRNVAPYMRVTVHQDTTYFRFACDSVFLYDDLEGGYDRIVQGSQIHFTHSAATGLTLWLGGRQHRSDKAL